MQVDSDVLIKNLDDKPIKEGDKEVRLSDIVKQAMLYVRHDDDKTTGEMKKKRYLIAKKVSKGGTVDLSQPEIDMINDCVGKGFTPLIVGRVDEILDPKGLADINEFRVPSEYPVTSVGVK